MGEYQIGVEFLSQALVALQYLLYGIYDIICCIYGTGS